MPSATRLITCALILAAVGCSTYKRTRHDSSPRSVPGGTYQDASQPDGAEGHWTDRYIDPVTAPFLFESPLIHSSVRPIAIYHEIPETSALKGGRLKLFALQGRYAITENFAIIATKSGYADLDTGITKQEEGYVDVAGGVKGIVLEDEEAGVLVTAGLTYESHAGDKDLLQGNGNGGWRPFVSGIVGMEDVNMIFGAGAYIPIDSGDESTFLDWHLHFSLPQYGAWVPLIEINGIHYTNDGRGLALGEEAVDYGNLGTPGVGGNDIITGAAGVRYRMGGGSDLGFAYEAPLSGRKDIFDQRFMVDWMLRF